ncbi:MAG: response regulator [Planctomycetes bacterium]|jgi:response regulator RpfG family c-di-GMP phosphodiesterase|nr:response regulator [Planctomycetota bacterium]MBT4029514.1 response regulator [Planctomycetota bacterium]MBT4560616.1 response regulator [Planctomycetota bacterium]MBT5102313.1 response regulator [Planctomycetota bacterium]MBT5119548.1 response regulator [Planctomycetota bacterium]
MLFPVIQKQPTGPSILLVEDDVDQRTLLQTALGQKGFRVCAVGDARAALHRMTLERFQVIVSDLGLPGMNGDEFLRHVRMYNEEIPFVMLTGVNDVNIAVQSMQDGADEYMLKPASPSTLHARIHAAVESRKLKFAQHKAVLDADKAQLEGFLRGVQALVNSLEAKDQYTRDHSASVAEVSMLMARQIPGMDSNAMREIRIGSMLHDIGKIGVPLEILHKDGPLDDNEWDEIKRHPGYGARILEPLSKKYPEVQRIVLHEHERWDGRGYPDGISGTDIPLGSRLIMIADTYDAICSTRPYRKARSKEEARDIILEGAGSQFDPDLVPVFDCVLADLPAPRA